MPSTPVAGLTSSVTNAGESVAVSTGGEKGGFITNPSSAADQGLAEAESLYVNPIGVATLEGNETTFEIPPGGTWQFIADQSTPTFVNAASAGHKFSCVRILEG